MFGSNQILFLVKFWVCPNDAFQKGVGNAQFYGYGRLVRLSNSVTIL